MKYFLLIPILLATQLAHAFEYKLQVSAMPGAQGLNVAGYQINPNTSTILGDCSYYIVTYSGGRGGHSVRTNHYNTCTWDLHGNLLSITPVAAPMPAPAQIAVNGSEIIYASFGTSSTGRDTKGFGFVSTPASHYSWTTANNGHAVIPYAPYLITATLTSDGDLPLNIGSVILTPSATGVLTPSGGNATLKSSTCGQTVQVGTSCSITVSYDPTPIACVNSAYGYGYTQLDLSLVTDAGASTDFIEGFTVTGIPNCDN